MRSLFEKTKHLCVIHISEGDPERFINLCRHAGLPVYDLVWDETGLFATMQYRDYKKAKEFEQKSGCHCSLVLQRGLVPLLQKYKKIFIFFLCLFFFFLLLFYSSGFIWHIRVEGENAAYTQEEIVAYTTKNLIPVGTKKSSIRLNELERSLREQYDQIAWITCEIRGTCLTIRLTETISDVTIEQQEEPCNIIAIRDGVVTELIATSGTRLVNPGDEVKKGDILITGVVNIYNEYEELIETNYVPASGVCYGQTVYRYEQTFPMEYVKKKQGKKKKYAVSLRLGSHITPIHTPKQVEGYEKEEEIHTFHIGQTYYLPFGLIIGTYNRPEYATMAYTEQEAIEKQKTILQNYIENLRKKGVEILENNVTIKCDENRCIASGTLVVREKIGVPDPLTVPTVPDETETDIQGRSGE